MSDDFMFKKQKRVLFSIKKKIIIFLSSFSNLKKRVVLQMCKKTLVLLQRETRLFRLLCENCCPLVYRLYLLHVARRVRSNRCVDTHFPSIVLHLNALRKSLIKKS